jgi:hypothetical protein
VNTNPGPSQHSRSRSAKVAAAPRTAHARAIEAALLVTLAALAFGTLRDAHAGTYKWTDDKGVVHYADKMPADAVNRANVQLDAQGRALKRVDAAPSADELRAKVVDVDKQKQAAREQEEAARRDRALLATFTREDDIELARSRALGTIDGQLQSARVYAAQLTRRQQDLLEKKIAAGNKGVAPAVERELESIERELSRTNALIAERRQESATVNARYDADKVRWRQLAAAGETSLSTLPPSQVGGNAPAQVLPTSGRR